MTLGNYTGTDGLRVRDFPEMRIEDGQVVFDKIPTMVIVRPELSKAGHQYFTFLSEEGCEYLKDYLEERIKGGEKLTPNSPIIRPKVTPKPFIRTVNIGDMIREAIKGDIEARYTTNKCRLPEDVIENMREAYRRSQEYLQTVVREVSRESVAEELRRHLLLVAGFTPEEINKLDLEGLSDEEFQEIIRKRLLGGDRDEDCIHRVVKLEDVERYLRMGWLYVSSLPDGRVIVKKPG